MLGLFGLEPVNILGDPQLATYGIIAAGLWPQTAYCMILYLTGLNAVDPEQIEAGRLDGAKGWRMLWHVVLPQLRPATFIAFVVTIIGALRSFDLISMMTNGGPFGSTRVLSFLMFEKALGEYGFRMGYGSAIAVVMLSSYFLWRMWHDADTGGIRHALHRRGWISLWPCRRPGAEHRTCGPMPKRRTIDAGAGHKAPYFHRSWVQLVAEMRRCPRRGQL